MEKMEPKVGRPGHEPNEKTRFLVAELYAQGIPQARIAKRLGINVATLTKHYREELDEHKDKLIAQLGKTVYTQAMGGDFKSQEFWLKCQGQWSYAKREQEQSLSETLLEKVIDKL